MQKIIKTTVTKAALAVIIAALLIRLNVIDALLLFILAGVIPGTGLSIPSLPMLLLTTGALYIILLRIPALKNLHRRATDKLISFHS
jgi:hypothetical protein